MNTPHRIWCPADTNGPPVSAEADREGERRRLPGGYGPLAGFAGH